MSSYRERRGAHRPAGLGPAGTIPWLVAAVLVIGIVAYGLGWVGGGSGGEEAGPSTTPASTSSQHTSSSTKATTKPTAKGTATSSATSSSPTSSVDPTQQVTVLNGTRTSGLAAAAAGTLRTAGWTIRSTGNFHGAVSTSTVFYGSASLAATAAAVAKDIGATAVQESADFGSTAVTVVLAGDYQP